MQASVLRNKSYAFALNIVELYKSLTSKKREFILLKQLMRSGTSIGANLREAEFAQSSKDFIHKMSIALKEANETDYWLSILKDSNYISVQSFETLYNANQELIRM
ncbi:four helix bundle protein [Winogradskyella sp. PC D3.3]